MRNIHATYTNEEYAECEKAKNKTKLTWHDFTLYLIRKESGTPQQEVIKKVEKEKIEDDDEIEEDNITFDNDEDEIEDSDEKKEFEEFLQ